MSRRSLSNIEYALLGVSFLSTIAGANGAVVRATASLARRLQPLDDLNDVTVQGGFMLVAYVIQYAILGGVFECTHPLGVLSTSLKPEVLARRRAQVRAEIVAGVVSLAVTVALAISWMYAGEPRTPFYAYFETHEWNPMWAVAGVIAYVISFDTYFYFSHLLLHEIEWLWHNVHFLCVHAGREEHLLRIALTSASPSLPSHHTYKEPTAFAQFAVHPFEAALQGPVGHFCVQLWFPVHPVQLAIMGLLSSAWAFGAHDGRWADFNNHTFHHSKGRGRKFYFNLGFLTPAWDVIMGTRWHAQHPMWLQWKKDLKDGKAFDTRDGSKIGTKNDVFEAYALDGPKAKDL